MTKRVHPWFKFYPQDYLDGTRKLSLEQRGAYMDMLCVQIIREGSIPEPMEDNYKWLSHQMHVSTRKAKSIVESIIEAQKFVRNTDGISNVRAQFELDSRLSQSRTNSEPTLNQTLTDPENPKKDSKNNKRTKGQAPESGCTRARSLESDIDNPIVPKRDDAIDRFEEFWKAFPGQSPPKGRKTDKAYCRKLFTKIVRSQHRDLKATATELIGAAQAYAATGPDPDYIPKPSTWLNKGRWEDHAGNVQPAAWWQSQDKLASMDAQRWRAGIGKLANGIWPIDKLGPPPGSPDCVVPADLVRELGLEKKYDAWGMKQ